MTAAVSFDRVSFFYDERPILRELCFSGEPGRLTLVLGANGAGKSSLLRLMAGLEQPACGKIRKRENLRIGYIGHPTFLYPALTAAQNLEFWAKVHRLHERRQAVADALAATNLAAHAQTRAAALSRGLAQRLNFSRCLMLRPELLLLDEPFTGLDEESQKLMRDKIKELKQAGVCIFLVSHSPAADGGLADEIFTLKGQRLTRQAA